MVILGGDEPVRRELTEALAGRRRAPGPIPALQAPHTVVGRVEDPACGAVPAPAPAGRGNGQAAASAPLPIGSLKEIARQAAREAERELIFRTLQHTRWNRREAAELLGISYKALLYKIKEAEMDRAS
jgi:two-component system response regulator AtoC